MKGSLSCRDRNKVWRYLANNPDHLPWRATSSQTVGQSMVSWKCQRNRGGASFLVRFHFGRDHAIAHDRVFILLLPCCHTQLDGRSNSMWGRNIMAALAQMGESWKCPCCVFANSHFIKNHFNVKINQGPGVCSSMAMTRQQFCEIGGFGTWSHFGFGQQEKPSFANYFSKVRRGRGEAERNWAKIESLVLPWRIWPDPRLD